jgi:predicted AlkP superfamily pyrophosphatase or phosphodiesterase
MSDLPAEEKKPRAAWINVDALRPDLFFDLLDSNKLPNFGLAFADSMRTGLAASVFPTVTMTCQASLATGALPGRHLLIGNGWFDRYGKRPSYRDYMETKSALNIYGYEPFGLPTGILPRRRVNHPLGDRDLSGATPTLYEALKTRSVRSAVVFNQISRGANEWVTPHRRDLIHFNLAYNKRVSFKSFERAVADRTISFIKGANHLHRVLHFYFPGIDGFSHRHGPDAERDFLTNTLDPILGRVLGALAKRRSLEEFYFILSADHGQTKVIPDAAHNVKSELVRRLLASFGLDLYIPGDPSGPKPASAVAFTQGGSFFIYLKNGETHNWYDPPRMRLDLIETAAHIAAAARKTYGPLQPGWLDIALIKDYRNERYVVLDSHKVLEPDSYFATPGHKWKYPDGARRVRGLFSKRSPDLILLANYEQGFFFGKWNDPGQHGNLSREDSLVPLMFAGPGIGPGLLPEDASILDVAPTIAALFSVRLPAADGRILPLF